MRAARWLLLKAVQSMTRTDAAAITMRGSRQKR
jgi:hypothetical protein